MARKAGPGRPPGLKSGYTVTEAAHAQRVAAGKKSKPRLRAGNTKGKTHRLPETRETRERDEAFRLTRGLCLSSTQMTVDRVAVEQETLRQCRERLARGLHDADSIKALAFLMAQLATMGETASLFGQVHDRVGIPRRSVVDANLGGVKPDWLGASRETQDWDKPPEEAHARPAGNGHAGNGSAH